MTCWWESLAPSVRHRRVPRFVRRPKRIRAQLDQRANRVQMTEARRPAERVRNQTTPPSSRSDPSPRHRDRIVSTRRAWPRGAGGRDLPHVTVEPREGAQLIPARPAVGAAVPHPVHQRLPFDDGFRRCRGRATSPSCPRRRTRKKPRGYRHVMFRDGYDPPLQAAIATEHVPSLVREIFPAERLDFHERSPRNRREA